jgi:hypothetical protein
MVPLPSLHATVIVNDKVASGNFNQSGKWLALFASAWPIKHSAGLGYRIFVVGTVKCSKPLTG